MPFQKLVKPQYPSRHWCLVGYPGSGKSTFAMQMKFPLLPIDADHRISGVIDLAEGDVYELSKNPADAVDPERIYEILKREMPGSDTKTIVIDSLTTIIAPKVTQAIINNDAGRNKNRMSAWKDKALSMRLLQDACTMWGCDVLWIYHLQDAKDEGAKDVTKPTLSATERARLYRSINLELHVVEEKDRRGVKVVWARRGRSGITLWDTSGRWVGMPEKIEEAVYGGLTKQDMDKLEQEAPDVFPTSEAAIEWSLEQGAFQVLQHAKNAYEKFKREHKGISSAKLSGLWVEDIERRLAKHPQPALEEPEPEAEILKPEPAPALDAPAFDKLDDFLFRLNKDFGLGETETKQMLKALGFRSWPGNGEARKKSPEMYLAVKRAVEATRVAAAKVALTEEPTPEQDIPF